MDVTHLKLETFLNKAYSQDRADDPANRAETDTQESDSKADQRKAPETVATYFQTNSSVVESLLNGILGADQIGSDSPIEGHAGLIALGVKDGSINPGDAGKEAEKGMTSAQAKEVIRLTEQYLGQGDYQSIKIFAAQLVGGAAGGTLLGGAAKGAGSLMVKVSGVAKGSMGGGRISTLLMAVKESIMRRVGRRVLLGLGSPLVFCRKRFWTLRRTIRQPQKLQAFLRLSANQ